MRYYLVEGNQQLGPFTIHELYERHIQPASLVRSEAQTDWVQAWEVDELKYILKETQRADALHAAQQPAASPQPAADGFQQDTAGAAVPPSMPAQPAPSGGGKLKLGCAVMALACVALVATMALTTPSKEQHREAITAVVTSAIDKASAEEHSNDILSAGFGVITKSLAGRFVGMVLDNTLTIKNYFIFNKGVISYDGKDHTISYGVLGHVFTASDDQLEKALGQKKSDSPAAADDDADSPAIPEADAAAPSQDDSNASAEANSQPKGTDWGDVARDALVDGIAGQVKKSIGESANDSTTARGLESIVDVVVGMIKGE